MICPLCPYDDLCLRFIEMIFDSVLYVPVNFQLCGDGPSWVEPVISKD